MNPIYRLRDVTLAYRARTVSRGLDLDIPAHAFTAVIGPNACGKSTLLRALARLLPARSGRIEFAGRPLTDYRARELAAVLALLPQEAIAPEGITVADLVARGRYPHQSLLQRWTRADEEAVDAALEATGTSGLAARLVSELSGGQRQRVWVALALAQQADTLLLDEPTTYLDIAHQYALLDLFDERRRAHGATVVAVLHDLNQAARYADHLIVMRAGQVVATGTPAEVLSAELIAEVFGMAALIIDDPITGTPLMVPAGTAATPARPAPASSLPAPITSPEGLS